MGTLSLLFIVAYLIGAAPFGLLIPKLKGIDIRQVGSGNPGATNVYRACGLQYALLVFFLDGTKGYLPTLLAIRLDLDPLWHILIGLTAILGHMYPIYIGFKGGKGAATGLGVLLALHPGIFLFIIIMGFLLILTVRYMVVATLVCTALVPILFYATHAPLAYTTFCSIIAMIIYWRHKENIKRLMQGKENRLHWKKKP